MMPCCAGSACDECARKGIENEGGKCTVCGEVANPEELIPYRLFRDKVGGQTCRLEELMMMVFCSQVDKFCNQTGYTKSSSQASSQPAPAPAVPLKPSLPDIVLPDPADPERTERAETAASSTPGPHLVTAGSAVKTISSGSMSGERERDITQVYVGKLPRDEVSQEDLKKHFSQYGEVVEVVRPLNNFKNKQPLGFAFIKFSGEEAVNELLKNGTTVMGKFTLEIQPAYSREKKKGKKRNYIIIIIIFQ